MLTISRPALDLNAHAVLLHPDHTLKQRQHLCSLSTGAISSDSTSLADFDRLHSLNIACRPAILDHMRITRPGLATLGIAVITTAGIVVWYGNWTPRSGTRIDNSAAVITPPHPTFRYVQGPRPTFPHTAPTIAFQGTWRTHVDPYLRFMVPVPSTWTIRSGGLQGAFGNATWETTISPPTPTNITTLGYSINIIVTPVTVAQRSSWEFAESVINEDNDAGRTEPTQFYTQFIGRRQLRRATTDTSMSAIFFYNDLMYQFRLNDGRLSQIDRQRDPGGDAPPDISPDDWEEIVSIFENVIRLFSPDPSVTSTVFFNEPLQPWEM